MRVRSDEHTQIIRRSALLFLRVADQVCNRMHQRIVRLPHQQLFAIHPQVCGLQMQMIFDRGKVQILRRGFLRDFERLLARELALVRQRAHQRPALGRPLRRNQQRFQEIAAVTDVHLRKQQKRIVHQICFAQHARQRAQRHRQIAPVQICAVPREDAGIERPRLLLQGGILRFENCIYAPPFRYVGKIISGSLAAEIGLRSRLQEEVRQVHRQHLRVVGPSGQRRPGQYAVRTVALQSGRKEAAHQRLMAAAGLNEPHRPFDRAVHVRRRLRPQRHVNLHAVLAGDHLLAAVGVLQSLQHQIERFIRNAVEIRCVARDQARPYAHGAFYRGIAQQIIVCNHPQHPPKRRKRALIGAFADRLAQSLL